MERFLIIDFMKNEEYYLIDYYLIDMRSKSYQLSDNVLYGPTISSSSEAYGSLWTKNNGVNSILELPHNTTLS